MSLASLPMLCLALSAQQSPERATTLVDRYTATTHRIVMRDGVHLHTIVVAPKQSSEPLPIVMLRTPYGVANWQRHFTSYMKDLAEDGYIFAFQDIRGRFGSEGTFVMQRPLCTTDPTLTIDECTDATDTITWLVANVARNNGRVGMQNVPRVVCLEEQPSQRRV